MKKKQLILVIIMMSCMSIFTQNASIEGRVKQADSTAAVMGVTVYLEETGLGSSTNGSGYYTITNIPAGRYTLVASAIGYNSLEKEISVTEGETIIANFTISEAVSTLSEVTIVAGSIRGLRDIPGSAFYLSPKEIQKFNYTDINRTLRAVPGVNMQEEDGFGLRPNIGLRGTGVERSSKITVMEDGVLMAPAPYAAPAAYYFPTIGRMQAIEILKGSSQIKYGPYTTGGAINLISTQIPNEFSARIILLGGSFGSKNLHAFVGDKSKNFAYLVETFQYGSNGFKQIDGGGNTGFDKKDYLAKFRVNTNENAKIYQSLSFKIGQAVETSRQTYLGLTQEDFEETPYRLYAASQKDEMNTEQLQLSITHRAEFSDFFKLTTTVYRSDFSRNWYKLDRLRNSMGERIEIGEILDSPADFASAYGLLTGISSTPDAALLVTANNRSYYAKGIQTVLGFTHETTKFSHVLDLGFRAHQDQIDRFQWQDEYVMDEGVMKLTKAGKQGTESNRIETADAIATYFQYKLGMGSFTLTSGLRYENITLQRQDYGTNDPDRTAVSLSERRNTVDVFIPGIGLDYQFSKYLSIFAGLHKGFAPPGSKEGTKPEESINYELGLRYTKNALSGQAVVFLNDYSNLLGSDLAAAGGAGTGDLFNGGEVQTKGLEFQLTYDLLSSFEQSSFSLPFSVVYTYTNAQFKNDFESTFGAWGIVAAGDQFPYMANNQFTLMLGLEHHKFSVNLSGRYMDAMRTTPGQGEIPSNEKTDAYFIFDASMSYALHKNIVLFASMTNLSNRIYMVSRWPSGLRPGMPGAFNVGLKANF